MVSPGVTTTISGYLIATIRMALHDSFRFLRANPDVSRHGNNAHTPYALPVFGTAVATVEAFLYESFFGQLCRMWYPESSLWMLEHNIERSDLLFKLEIVPHLLFGKSFDKGRQPYQDFHSLVKIRNDLIHYKQKSGYAPYILDLSTRGIAMSTGEDLERDYDWVSKIRCTECIRWAHNTVCNVIHKLVELVPEVHRRHLGGDMLLGFVSFTDKDISRFFAEFDQGTNPIVSPIPAPFIVGTNFGK